MMAMTARFSRILRPLSAACLSAAAVLAVPPAVAAGSNWRAYTYNSVATVASVKGLTAMMDEIKKDTQGQLNIRLYLGGTLPITATDITQAVGNGVVQMGDDAFFMGNAPIGGLVRLPMLLPARPEFEKAWTIESAALRAALDQKNIVLLGHYTFPENVMWSKKKLTSLADLKGQKIRVISPEQSDFIQILGGIPVTLGTSEVAAALDRGVIDGVLTASSGYGYVWRDLLKYNYRLNVSFIDSLVLVNKGAWEKLAPDVQAKVQSIVDDYTGRITASMQAEDQDLTKKMADAGMVVTEPSAADLAEAQRLITPYWAEWAGKRPGASDVLQKVRATVGR
jgi:TRAP-type transport system periplasmic protein